MLECLSHLDGESFAPPCCLWTFSWTGKFVVADAKDHRKMHVTSYDFASRDERSKALTVPDSLGVWRFQSANGAELFYVEHVKHVELELNRALHRLHWNDEDNSGLVRLRPIWWVQEFTPLIGWQWQVWQVWQFDSSSFCFSAIIPPPSSRKPVEGS